MSLVYNLKLSVDFEAKKIRFELKKGGKVILKKNMSSPDYQKAIERILWNFKLHILVRKLRQLKTTL